MGRDVSIDKSPLASGAIEVKDFCALGVYVREHNILAYAVVVARAFLYHQKIVTVLYKRGAQPSR
jgi:hypothetical protein